MENNDRRRRRRDLLEKIGGYTQVSVFQWNNNISFERVEKIEDWEKVPNFFAGQDARSDMMKQLTNVILQLQAEVDRLRRSQ